MPEELFTDFEGRFRGILAAVRYVPATYTSEWSGTAAKYECDIRVEYDLDLLAELEEGMMLAVENFRSSSRRSRAEGIRRFTVMVVTRVIPRHYGLSGVGRSDLYSLQFEVIGDAVNDWASDDKSVLMIELRAVPINYDLIIDSEGKFYFRKGFSHPKPGADVYVLSVNTIDDIYNGRVREAMGVESGAGSADPRESPRVGLLRMFQESGAEVPIYVDLEKLVRYHFGVFSFTGGGKSNLLANLFRRILYHTDDTKIVIFDVSCEYSFLLCDVLTDESIPASVILEEEAETGEEFARSVVKPRDFEDDPRANRALKEVFDRGIVTFYQPPTERVPTYGDVLFDIRALSSELTSRPHYIEALEAIRRGVQTWMEQNNKSESNQIDEVFVEALSKIAAKAMEDYGVSDRSTLYAWAKSRTHLVDTISRARNVQQNGITVSDILGMLHGDTRLIVISIADPDTLRQIVIHLTSAMLKYRKRSFEIRPYILFVFDEAQEFIPSKASGLLDECSRAVERLLRQGRKYGLGGAVATQRIAYLNTNVLQQLHTFFVGTLPRPYDRTVVSSSFQIDLTILDKTLEFPPGSWLLSSYIATGIDNVPIFVRADNSEDVLREHIERL